MQEIYERTGDGLLTERHIDPISVSGSTYYDVIFIPGGICFSQWEEKECMH